MSSFREKYNYKELIRLFIGYWQWFLLSLFICLCTAYLYTQYATPVYKMTGKLLIKTTDSDQRLRLSNRLSSNGQSYGIAANNTGVDNEAEIIRSTVLMLDVVKQLKLYAVYQKEGWPKDEQVYRTQPVNVDLDAAHLDTLDYIAYDELRSIRMKMERESDASSTIVVKGVLKSGKKTAWGFSRHIKSLPAKIKTPFGTLTFTRNPEGEEMRAGEEWSVTINPPLYHALRSLRQFAAKPAKQGRTYLGTTGRYYTNKSSIIHLLYADQNIKRGTDILNQLVTSYNNQANDDKNEIALHVDNFINERLVSLNKELGGVDDSITSIKEKATLSLPRTVSNALRESNKYSTKLMEAATQSMIIDDLIAYINKPANKSALIPSSIGLKDRVSLQLIRQYNTLVQQRNRLLLSTSEESVQAKQLNATIIDVHSSILTALQQAKQATDITSEALWAQYEDYHQDVTKAPDVQRALTDVGREMRVKAWLYRLLLRKREENSMSLAVTVDRGNLIDAPHSVGRIRPRLWLVYGVALGVGLGGPYAVLIFLGLLRYKLEDLEELKELTQLPIIANTPIVSDADKDETGIVVRFGRNSAIDEVFSMMRTNLLFMMGEGRHVILFTSTTSGEGKSFNSTNLAVSYALTEKRVILCGLDIRKPALGSLFNLSDRRKGITTLLTKETVTKEDIEKQIQPSGVNDHLDLLLSGPIPPNPTELLARDSLRQILDILKETYDYIILDTAPVGLVTDTLQISKLADVTVFVCRAKYTPTIAIAQLNGMAEEKLLTNPCIVLNGSSN